MGKSSPHIFFTHFLFNFCNHTYILIKSVVQESVHSLGTHRVGEAGTTIFGFALFGFLGTSFYFSV